MATAKVGAQLCTAVCPTEALLTNAFARITIPVLDSIFGAIVRAFEVKLTVCPAPFARLADALTFLIVAHSVIPRTTSDAVLLLAKFACVSLTAIAHAR